MLFDSQSHSRRLYRRIHSFGPTVSVGLLLGALVACSSPMPAGDVVDISLQQSLQSMPTDHPAVRWGGTIAEITNLNDETIVQIVSRPLSGGGRPAVSDRTDGRFLAKVKQFLEPTIVKPGREITVIGRLSGSEKGVIGEAAYTFPVVEVDRYQLWPKRPKNVAPYAYSPYFWHESFWHDWPYSHRHLH